MGIKVPSLISTTKQILKQKSFNNRNQEGSPKGHVTVYVGCDEKKRHVVPISYLRDPSFQQLLNLAEEEFGFSHPMGGLTIPCSEETFLDITCHLAN